MGTPMLLIMLLIKISATYPWMLLICLKCCWYAWNVADSIRMLPICIECCLYSENVADTFWMLLISHYSFGSKRCESGRYRTIVDGLSSQCGRSLVLVDSHSTKSGRSLEIEVFKWKILSRRSENILKWKWTVKK